MDVDMEEKEEKDDYDTQVKAVNCISKPLAPKKTTKKLFKVVKKASNAKHVRRGVKEVVKAVRKGEKGLAIIAGDIYPIDVISHLPVLLEEAEIPYCFVPSKQSLGASACTKRPTSIVLINPKKGFDSQDLYDEVYATVKAMA
ncbi:hypothetical protein ScalyP_jg11940 [Parmales sp. scaly parma]|nr:hypothetical protein ScalyP_jg11940 [Parmales sp. scaly parma]